MLPSELSERLGCVRSVGAITGAGVSFESGIRTYRGRGGLYDDPEEGERTVEALTGTTLRDDPDRTWRTVAELARQAASALPNDGHRALVAIERKVASFSLLTQNVDGLHRQAGSREIIEIHGNLESTRCMSCAWGGSIDTATLQAIRSTPRCVVCGGGVRPDVVLFGELLDMRLVERIHRAFHDDVPDLILVAGTSALFPYITEPVFSARQAGKLTVEINPEPTVLSEHVDHSLRGNAGTYLPLIEQALPSRIAT